MQQGLFTSPFPIMPHLWPKSAAQQLYHWSLQCLASLHHFREFFFDRYDQFDLANCNHQPLGCMLISGLCDVIFHRYLCESAFQSVHTCGPCQACDKALYSIYMILPLELWSFGLISRVPSLLIALVTQANVLFAAVTVRFSADRIHPSVVHEWKAWILTLGAFFPGVDGNQGAVNSSGAATTAPPELRKPAFQVRLGSFATYKRESKIHMPKFVRNCKLCHTGSHIGSHTFIDRITWWLWQKCSSNESILFTYTSKTEDQQPALEIFETHTETLIPPIKRYAIANHVMLLKLMFLKSTDF